MAGLDQEQRQRVALMGKTLRKSLAAPTDTYITGDIPLLLTRLSQVAPIPPRKGENANIDPQKSRAHNDHWETPS